MKKSELRQIIKEVVIKILNEATRIDISYALKDIDDYNRGLANIEQTAKRIIKNLGYKITKRNLENTIDHLEISSDSSDRIPKDKDVVKELYKILK